MKKGFFNARSAVSSAIGALGHLAENKCIPVDNKVDPEKRIFADQVLFGEVLKNLLSNSIKFCRKGDQITFFTPEDRPSAVGLRDTGVGINPRIIMDIFKYEVKTSTRGTDQELGTGLGLPYSHEIMVFHGGSLTVESIEGAGSAFYAEVPAERPVVLIVDDEIFHRALLKNYLSGMGVNIMEAANGSEALLAIKERAPHVVVADVMMPVMDGFELLNEVRKNPATSATPFIIVTGMADMDVNQKSALLGADDFMVKPVSGEEFVSRLRKFIG
ncbi:MAG: response regulator [Nitrospinae bacterium]|nr:response regulator [Nitrospinota bacterium]